MEKIFSIPILTDILGDFVGSFTNVLISAIFIIVETVIGPILQGAFFWVIEFFYKLFITTPLLVINLLINAFRFFASGMVNIVLGMSTNPDGSINYQFNFNTPLGTIVIFVFVFAIGLFFVNFLLSFTQKTKVDASGNPMNAQLRRFQYLKWPLIMVFLLLGGPAILLFCDWAMGFLIGRASNQVSNKLTYVDVNQAHYLLNQMTLLKNETAIYLSTYNSTMNDVKEYIKFFEAFNTATVGFNGNAFTPTEIDQIRMYFDNVDTDFYQNFFNNQKFVTYQMELNTFYEAYKKLDSYVNATGANVITFSSDLNTVQQVISRFAVGSYVSPQDSALLNEVANNIKTLRNDMNSFKTALTAVSQNSIVNRDSLMFANACISNIGYFNTSTPPATLPTNAAFVTSLDSIYNVHALENMIDMNSMASNLSAKNSSIETALNPLYIKSTSYYFKIIYGDDQLKSLSYYSNRTAAKEVATISSDFIVKMVYSIVTGDPNSDNWNDSNGSSYMVNVQSNLVHWVVAVLFVFGLVLIVYTYMFAAAKRSFYLLFYWILGFIYIGNGITNEKAVKTWTRMFIGKWWCIFVLYAMFELVVVFAPMCIPVIDAGLTNASLDVPVAWDSNVNVLAVVAKCLMLESGFQVIYIVWNKYQGTFGVSEESFQMQKSNTFTEGKQAFEKAKGAVSDVAGAVGKVATSGYTLSKHVGQAKDKWRDKEQRKLDKNKQTYDRAQREWETDDKTKRFKTKDEQEGAAESVLRSPNRATHNSTADTNNPNTGTAGSQGINVSPGILHNAGTGNNPGNTDRSPELENQLRASDAANQQAENSPLGAGQQQDIADRPNQAAQDSSIQPPVAPGIPGGNGGINRGGTGGINRGGTGGINRGGGNNNDGQGGEGGA